MKSDDQVCEPTVFVVDDDESVRASLVFLIKTVHLKAKAYSSAQEFLDDYDPNIPGCAVLDVRMPGMSGLDLLKETKRLWPALPVAMITAYGDPDSRRRAIEAGASDFLTTPLDFDELKAKIRQMTAAGQAES